MTNTEALNQRIGSCGIKKGKIAEMLGITKVSLSNKIHNRTQFKQSEIGKLVSLLGIQDPDERDNIFFGEMLKNVEHHGNANLLRDNVFKENVHGEISKRADADTNGIGSRIRSARRARKITQQELAAVLGIRGTTLAKYERGSIDGIPPKKVISICHALDVSPNYLFGWDEPSNT